MFFVSVKSKLFCKRNKEKSKNKKTRAVRCVVCMCAALLLLGGWMAYASLRMPSYSYCEGVGKYLLQAESAKDREAFFSQFGYKARELRSCEVIVPSCKEVLNEYNQIQKSHGMNLLPYGDQKATYYVYSLQKDGQELFGFLTVCRGRAVAVHISDCEYPSMIRGLREQM